MRVPRIAASNSTTYNHLQIPPHSVSPTARTEGGLNNLLGIVRRQLLIVVGVTTTFFGYSAWKVLNEATQYSGDFQILVEPVNAENAELALPNSDNSRSRSSELDYPTQVAILKSPEILEEVSSELQQTYPKAGRDSLARQIQINRLGQTKLLEVYYQSGSAAQTKDVLNALAKKYLEYSLNERQTYLRQGLQFVDEQIDTSRDQLNRLQNSLESFQRQNSFTNPESQSEQLSTQKQSLLQREQELEQELTSAQAKLSALQQEDGIQVSIESDPAYQKLSDQIREIEAEIATEVTRFKPDNPAIQSLEKQRDNLLPLLQRQAEQFLDTRLAEVTIQIQSLETRLQAIRDSKTLLDSQIQTIPALNRRYANLQKEIEIASNSLTSFLETRQDLQVEVAQREIPWELVKEPYATPIDSNTARSLLTALLTGLALGTAVAYAFDKLDNTYHSAESIKADVDLPVLGILPFTRQLRLNKAMEASDGNATELVESLRVVHANLQTLRQANGTKIRTVTISSTASGDGKSMLALNWALTAASMGQRVLLIDGVLRNPYLHHTLNLPNQVGLSDLLSTELTPPEGLQQVTAEDKLYVVTGGNPVSNPAGLLSSPKMRELISYYRKAFDLIIIDTPSLSGLADSNIINRQTDGLILVTRLDRTDKTILHQALESLQSTQAPVLGMVINGSKTGNPTLRDAANFGSQFPNEHAVDLGSASAAIAKTQNSEALAENN